MTTLAIGGLKDGSGRPDRPAVGRGKWARRPKPKGKDAIRHVRIGRVLYHELRTGSGTKTWKSWRPPDIGQTVRPQTVWNSPALAHCLDGFYGKVDALIAQHEREEYRRLCEEHRRFVERQEERRRRRVLENLQRGRLR